VEATATETASNWTSPDASTDDMASAAASHSSPAVRGSLRLPNQSRARKKRDPIEFSFHDLISFVSFCRLFLNFIMSLPNEDLLRHEAFRL
jgi:hypothetical protein